MPLPFVVHVEDRAGNPAPCVALRTTDAQVLVADADGTIAFDEPGLMGSGDVWFHVESAHYDVPADFFGYEGVVLRPVSGGEATVVVDRRSAPGPCDAPDQGRAAREGFVDPPFELQVVDDVTGRGVPLARVDGPRGPEWTDAAGHLAVRDPALFDGPGTWTFEPLDGYSGGAPLTLTPTPGGAATLAVTRENVAERLYRITGRGVYRDSVLLGLPTPTASPVLNGRVMGQDTILVLPWGGDWLWLWGDTIRPEYPLGLFDVAGAVARPLADPADGVDLEYFVDATGFARAMAPIPGSGPTWLAGPFVVDDAGTPRTVSVYGNFDADLTANERGLAVLDEATVEFRKDTAYRSAEVAVTTNRPLARDGRVVLWADRLRLDATLAAARDPRTWEAWTPFLPDGARDTWPDGSTRWAWRTGATRVQLDTPDDLVTEHTTGRVVIPHGDSVVWSAWRHRYVRVFTENGGTSWLGEMWYAEADSPMGPWGRAVKIASHTDYTSYNPMLHPELSGDGRELLWQATYTAWLATDTPTPRYDYNQMMYRLDLDDPRVGLPTPVYEIGTALGTVADLRPGDAEPRTAFLAPDRPFAGAVAVGWDGPACDGGRLGTDEVLGRPVFYVAAAAPVGGLPLWRAAADGVEGLYVDVPTGFVADPTPVGWVWPLEDDARSDVVDWLPEVRVDAGPDRCVAEEVAGDGVIVPIDASGSPGTAGGTWSVTLDGVEVATAPRADVRVAAGRHVLGLDWTSPEGTPFHDDVRLAVAAADPGDPEPPPPAAHTGAETGDPSTSPPPTGIPDAGCGCASTTGPGAPWLFLVGAVTLRRRSRAASPRRTQVLLSPLAPGPRRRIDAVQHQR